MTKSAQVAAYKERSLRKTTMVEQEAVQ